MPHPKFTFFLDNRAFHCFCIDFGDTKKMRDVRTSRFHQVPRRDLRYVSEDEGFLFAKIIHLFARRPRPFVDSFMDGCKETVETADAAEAAKT